MAQQILQYKFRNQGVESRLRSVASTLHVSGRFVGGRRARGQAPTADGSLLSARLCARPA